MTKRRVLLDGNGSSQINVEGLGVYVPASELAQIKQNVGNVIEGLKVERNLYKFERDQLEAKLTKLDELATRFIEDSEEIAEFFESSGGRNHLVLAKDVRELADEMADLLNDQAVDNRHIDDIGIDEFANAMHSTMANSRAKGRSGWDDKTKCSGEYLAALLVIHLTKGNAGTFVDVADFCMMLHQRQESPMLLVDAVNDIRAKAIMEFAEVPRVAYLSGGVTAELTVYDVYQSARNHVKDNYGYDTKAWDDDDATTARNALNEIKAKAVIDFSNEAGLSWPTSLANAINADAINYVNSNFKDGAA